MTHINLLAAKGWGKVEDDQPMEAHRSVRVPKGGSWFLKLLAFSGPGYLVAVGYMDPGNWATDLIGGSHFGYTLLSVILLANLGALLLQYLSAKLGIATGRDLAQMCRASFPRWLTILLWLAAEAMIVACDMAEVIGSAIALELLFNIPITLGVLITGLDALLILMLQKSGFRVLESIVMGLIVVVMLALGIDVYTAQPPLALIIGGLIPTSAIFSDPNMLYIALGIVGATIMPHNLFLHSALVQTREYEETPEGKREALRYAAWDSGIALTLAFITNAAILILSARLFHVFLLSGVADIRDAYWLMSPVLGLSSAAILFGLALLASGQNATITGTLAGQVVMEGFIRLRMKPWLRRLVSRGLAIIPALYVAAHFGSWALTDLLILSQVILSMQLPFAVIPLVYFTGSRKRMGSFVNAPLTQFCAAGVAIALTAVNGWLLYTLL